MDEQSAFVVVGSHVEIQLINRANDEEYMAFDIVPDNAADFANGFLGESTGLAKVLLGERIGSVIPYLKDNLLAVRILSVTPSVIKPSNVAATKRKETFRKAIHEIERTNAINFASSFSGKWGDYDPESILQDTESLSDDHEAG